MVEVGLTALAVTALLTTDIDSLLARSTGVHHVCQGFRRFLCFMFGGSEWIQLKAKYEGEDMQNDFDRTVHD